MENIRKLHLLQAALRQAVLAHLHLAHPLHRQVNVILLRDPVRLAAHQAQAAAAQTLAAHRAAALPAHHLAARLAAHPLTLHLPNPATLTQAKISTRKDQT